MRLRAHAKINLALRVGPLGADGFHPVATVLQTVSLADMLYARRAEDDDREASGARLRLRVEGASLPEVNTVTRAVELLAEALRVRGVATPALEMRLRKRVPLGAGLGGGSSDAVAALAACLRLWEPPTDPAVRGERLQSIAAEIGSDVPFFLRGGTALGTGRGTRIERLEPLPRSWFVLAAPRVHAPTASVYAAFDRLAAARDLPASPPRPPYRPRLDVDWMGNDLAEAAVLLHPEIEDVRSRLQRLGARPAQVSGSGAASFGAFADRRSASRAAARLRADGVWAVVAVSVSAARHRCALLGARDASATPPA